MKHFDSNQVLKENHIYLDIEAVNSTDLIRQVVSKLAEDGEISDVERLIEDAITREEELPTSLDNGIAMPHARCNAVNNLICAFARPKTPLDFKSPDGIPTDLIFFSAIPSGCVDEYLHLTAKLVRKLKNTSNVEKLRSAKSSLEVLEILGVHS